MTRIKARFENQGANTEIAHAASASKAEVKHMHGFLGNFLRAFELVYLKIKLLILPCTVSEVVSTLPFLLPSPNPENPRLFILKMDSELTRWSNSFLRAYFCSRSDCKASRASSSCFSAMRLREISSSICPFAASISSWRQRTSCLAPSNSTYKLKDSCQEWYFYRFSNCKVAKIRSG